MKKPIILLCLMFLNISLFAEGDKGKILEKDLVPFRASFNTEQQTLEFYWKEIAAVPFTMIIEKSTDQQNIQTVGEVLSQNIEIGENPIFFVANNQCEPFAWYRIRLVDYDGETVYCSSWQAVELRQSR